MVVEPLSTYHASLWPALAALMLGGLASLAIALGMAVTIARKIIWPVLWLTQKAERVAATAVRPRSCPTRAGARAGVRPPARGCLAGSFGAPCQDGGGRRG